MRLMICIMRSIAALVMLLAFAPANVARAQSDLAEDGSFLQVAIGGKLVRLEALTVKRATLAGRLPIALIVHGKPITQGQMSDKHARDLVSQARDLARRGWLAVVVMRRGYGASDGPAPMPLSCASASLVERFNAEADDLSGTLDAIAQRPDADRTRIVAIGASDGGAAVMALSARNLPGLAAVINVSGGLRFESCPKEDLLVSALRAYGAKSRVPSLWIYASNDSFFGPALVERMRAAFLEGGGDAKLVMLEPEGKEGHNLFGTASGRKKWLMEMDGFLRFLKLPTWTSADVDSLMWKLDAKESVRGFLEGYIAGPSEKALARETGGSYMVDSWGSRTIEEAHSRALHRCLRARSACEVVMENDRWIGPSDPHP
jgi:dienelactone hydrolase